MWDEIGVSGEKDPGFEYKVKSQKSSLRKNGIPWIDSFGELSLLVKRHLR